MAKKRIRELTVVEKFYIDGHKFTAEELSDELDLDIAVIETYIESKKKKSKIDHYITKAVGGRKGVVAATPLSAEHPTTKVDKKAETHVFRRQDREETV